MSEAPSVKDAYRVTKAKNKNKKNVKALENPAIRKCLTYADPEAEPEPVAEPEPEPAADPELGEQAMCGMICGSG